MNDKLNEVQETFFSSSTESIGKILAFWPSILAASGVLLLGLLISFLIGKFFNKIGEKLKLSMLSEKIGFTALLKKANIKLSPSTIIASFFQGWVLTVFLLATANILKLTAVSDFLEKITDFLPSVLVAFFILLFAFRMGDFIGAIAMSLLSVANSHAAKILSVVIKNIVIAFGVMAALVELEIAPELVQILFAGLIFMMALAGGLAFGLGGKDVVRELLEDMRHHNKD